MKTIKEFRDKMLVVLDDLKSGKLDYKTAHEINSAARVVIKTIFAQLMYSETRKTKDRIEFLECEEEG